MFTRLLRLYGRMRTDLVRSRVFDRPIRVRTGAHPNLTAREQLVYDRACARLKSIRPVNGGRA